MMHRCLVLCLAVLCAAVPLSGQNKTTSFQTPLFFEPNHGQAPASVRFLSRGNGRDLLLMDKQVVLTFAEPALSIRMKLAGQNPATQIEGVNPQKGVTNFFHGNDPDKWRTGVPHYAKVKYTSVYPGIDLIYYGNERQLEYDFVVHPLADLTEIQMQFEGVDGLTIGPDGDLILSTPAGEIRHRRPIAFQRRGREEDPVEAGFVIHEDRVGFVVGSYDRSRPLIIDPTLTWSSYMGGTGDDLGNDVTVDASGNVYVTGYTQAVTTQTSDDDDPPVITFQTDPARGHEMFVTKIDSSGALVFKTYVGGGLSDEGHGLALDSAGNIYVTGFTSSTDFPVAGNAFQSANAGVQDAYIVKLSNTGDVILLSSYLGGNRGDRGFAIAVDTFGNAYIAGSTHGETNVDPNRCSSTFPVVNAIQSRYGCGVGDAFLTKVTPAGSIGFSTLLGGGGIDVIYDLRLDADENIVLAGSTSSQNFPVANALDATFNGGSYDIFIAKLNSDGSSFAFSTYFGGSGDDEGVGLAVDQNKTIYVTGYTTSFNFPLKNAPQQLPGGSYDAFLIKLHPDGQDADFSIYIAAEDMDGGVSVDVDSSGYIYVVGFTSSLRFFAINAISGFLRGSRDGFVIKIYPDASNVVYSTYLGGFGFDGATAIDVDSAGNAHVTGFTSSFDFPVSDGAFQKTVAGVQDAFIVKINADDVKTSSAFSFAPGGGTQVATAGLSANPTFGYASIEVAAGLSPSGLAIIDVRSAGVLVNEVSIPIPAPTTTGRFVAMTTAASTSAVTLVNGNDEEVTIDAYFTPSTGGSSLIRSFKIPAHFHLSGLLTGQPFNVPFDLAGNFTFLSNLPVSAIALLILGAGTSEPANIYLPIKNPFLANDRPLFIPQIADGQVVDEGGNWSTAIYLTNSTEDPISGEIRFFKAGLPGEPSVPLEMDTSAGTNSVFPYTIEHRGLFVLTGTANANPLVTGFAEIVPTGGSAAPFAFATLQGRHETAGFVSTTVEAVEAVTDFRMYAEISGTFANPDLSARPALAAANTSALPATVNLTLTGFDGTDSGLSGQLVLQPREHISTFLHEIPGFQNLPNPYAGVLRATTSQPGVVFSGFRARYNELGLFLVTATGPLNDLGNTNPVIFPHLIDGGGYATQLIVTSGSPAGGASGTVRFFDSVGRPLNLSVLP